MPLCDVIGFLAYFPNSHFQVTRLTEMPAFSIFCAHFTFIVIKEIFKLKMNFVAVSTCHFDIIDIIHRRDNQHWHNYCL